MKNGDVQIFFLKYFIYENMVVNTKNIFPRFVKNNFINLFNITYPYDNILYRYLVKKVDIYVLRRILYDKVIKLFTLYNNCLNKNIDVFTKKDNFLNYLVIKDSNLYNKLKNVKIMCV